MLRAPILFVVALTLIAPNIGAAPAWNVSGTIVPAGPVLLSGTLSLEHVAGRASFHPVDTRGLLGPASRWDIRIEERRWSSPTVPSASESPPNDPEPRVRRLIIENPHVDAIVADRAATWTWTTRMQDSIRASGANCSVRTSELDLVLTPASPDAPDGDLLTVTCHVADLVLVPYESAEADLFGLRASIGGKVIEEGRPPVQETFVLQTGLISREDDTADPAARYENVWQSARIRAYGIPAQATMHSGHVSDVTLQTTQIGWTGQTVLPAFVGEVWRGAETLRDSPREVVLHGTFLLGRAPSPPQAMWIGGTAEPDAAAPPEAAPVRIAPQTQTIVLVAAGMLGLALLWKSLPVAWALFARVSRSRVLENPVRQQLFEIIRQNPGIRLHALVEAADVGRNATVHHLKTLQTAGLVRLERDGRRLHCFAAGERSHADARTELLRQPRVLRLLAIVRDGRSITQVELARRLAISQGTVSVLVRRLVSAGIIEGSRAGPGTRYRVDAKALAPHEERVIPRRVPLVEAHA